MSKTITSSEDLENMISSLKRERKEKLEEFKFHMHELRESLTPSNIIRNAVSEVVHNPARRKAVLMGAGSAIVMGFIRRFTGKKIAALGEILLPQILSTLKKKKQP